MAVFARIFLALSVVQPGAVTFQGTDPTAFGFIVLFTLKKHGTLAKASAGRPGTISKTCSLGFLGGQGALDQLSQPLR